MPTLPELRAQRQLPDLTLAGALPAQILERLAAEGINSLEQWRAAGARRKRIFGVTPSWIGELDRLARAVRS